jgi:hypothetical protein
MAENVSDTQSDIFAWTIPYDLKVGTVDLLKIATITETETMRSPRTGASSVDNVKSIHSVPVIFS